MSLRWRITLVVTTLFLLVMVMSVVLVVRNAQQAVHDELESTADLTLQLLGEALASLEASGGARDKARLIEHIGALENARHLCIELRTTEQSAAPDGAGCRGEGAVQAPGWFTYFLTPAPVEFRRSLALADAADAEIVVRADPADEIGEVWRDARDLLILIALVSLAANAIVFMVLSRAMRPIGTILSALDGIEHGRYRRLPAFRLPELARIARSFNHMAEALERSVEDNRTLTRRSLDIQEQERRHMAHELHDDMGQSLTAIKADAVLISNHSRGSAPRINESAQAILSVSSHVFDVIRSMIKRLRPALLDELGLVTTLGETIDDWNTRHPQQFCQFSASGDIDKLDEQVSIHLYRIVQECLTNIDRHAGAAYAEVALERASDGAVYLKVSDDGRGFEPEAARRGLGLLGMRERVASLGGALHIDSRPGAGTRIEVQVPEASTRHTETAAA